MGTKFSLVERVLIDKPIEQVFAFVTNFRNDVRWRQGVRQMDVWPDGQAWVGTRTYENMRSYGRRLRTEAEITAFVPNQRVDFHAVRGPILIRGSRAFEERGDQTLVTLTLAGELDAFYSLLWPLLRRPFERRFAGDLHRLKRLLEAAPETAPSRALA